MRCETSWQSAAAAALTILLALGIPGCEGSVEAGVRDGGAGERPDATVERTDGPADTDARPVGAEGGAEAGPGMDAGPDGVSVASGLAAEVARKLGRDPFFLIGLSDSQGLDLTLGAPLDIRYRYLVNGWPDWNPGGEYVTIIANEADAGGMVPMFTTWTMAGMGDGNTAAANDAGFMQSIWSESQLMFEKLRDFDKPAIVHLEPDWWGYAQGASGGVASNLPAQVKINPTCTDLPNDVSGMGACWIRMARTVSPKVVVGLAASNWGRSADSVADFLRQVHATDGDIIVVENLDRDAGCFEAAIQSDCQRAGGPWYWDETNQTSPNFREHLDWVKVVSDTLKLPVLWWQMPLGVPSDVPGGAFDHYRDNRVHYLFSHVQEYVDVNGLGACFGAGAQHQTTVASDGGQFRDAVNGYRLGPVPLP